MKLLFWLKRVIWRWLVSNSYGWLFLIGIVCVFVLLLSYTVCSFIYLESVHESLYSPWLMAPLIMIESGMPLEFLSALDGKDCEDMLLGMVFVIWGLGTIIVAFLTGVFTDALNKWRSDALEGRIHYAGFHHHIAILGWDARCLGFLSDIMVDEGAKIVIVTEKEVSQIHDKLKRRFPKEYNRFFVIHEKTYDIDTLQRLNLTCAKEILINSDEDSNVKMITSMRIFNHLRGVFANKENANGKKKAPAVICRLQIAGYETFNKALTMKLLSSSRQANLELLLWNFEDSWARQIWSIMDSRRRLLLPTDFENGLEGMRWYPNSKLNRKLFDFDLKLSPNYHPLKFRRNPEAMSKNGYFELCIIGFDDMAKFLINHAVNLATGTGNRITVFDNQDKEEEYSYFAHHLLEQMNQSSQCVALSFSAASPTERDLYFDTIMKSLQCSVTIVVNLRSADDSMGICSQLTTRFRYEQYRLLLRQETECEKLALRKLLLRNTAMFIDYFGMTDGIALPHNNDIFAKTLYESATDTLTEEQSRGCSKYVRRAWLHRHQQTPGIVLADDLTLSLTTVKSSDNDYRGEWNKLDAKCRAFFQRQADKLQEQLAASLLDNSAQEGYRLDASRKETKHHKKDTFPLELRHKKGCFIINCPLPPPMTLEPWFADFTRLTFTSKKALALVNKTGMEARACYQAFVDKLHALRKDEYGEYLLMEIHFPIGDTLIEEEVFKACRILRIPVIMVLPKMIQAYRQDWQLYRHTNDLDAYLRWCTTYRIEK